MECLLWMDPLCQFEVWFWVTISHFTTLLLNSDDIIENDVSRWALLLTGLKSKCCSQSNQGHKVRPDHTSDLCLLSVALTFPSQTVLLLSGCQIPQLWSIVHCCSIMRWRPQSAIHSSSVDKAGMTAPWPHGKEENVLLWTKCLSDSWGACKQLTSCCSLSDVKRWHRRQDWIFSFSYLYYYYFNHKNIK